MVVICHIEATPGSHGTRDREGSRVDGRVEGSRGSAQCERGISLTEALIGLVVVGVLLAVALPKLIPVFRQGTVGTTADRVVLAHSLARATAVRYGRVARLNLDPSLGRFWVDRSEEHTSELQSRLHL